jgi:polysaccharide deacetylase family protein (PEP-CTERM system associated)
MRATYNVKTGTPLRKNGRLVNALSVDVEDYFHAQALGIDPGRWEAIETRVEANTSRVLDLFGETGARATFFVLGWVAKRFPGLVRRIVEEGHELASHGWIHARVDRQTPGEFRTDIRKSKDLLEQTTGTPVRGYRAATFSINHNTLWAFSILAEEGFAYSSSVYPIRHDYYGMPTAPRFAFFPLGDTLFEEYPLTSMALAGHNIPCGGGGYFRLLPYSFSRWAMVRVNNRDHQPCIFYFHPWEIDPTQPRQPSLPWKSRLRHYTNLDRMETRLRRLMGDFAWDRMDRVLLDMPR